MGRGWKSELSLGVIHGLILTRGLIKPSARVTSTLLECLCERPRPRPSSIIKPQPPNQKEIFTSHAACTPSH